MKQPTMTEQSRKEWVSKDTAEDIKLGCLQRIADASEKMASNYIQLQKDYIHLKECLERYKDFMNKQSRTIIALRGHITKLKKKISNK
jgi:hypothetical protein